MSAAFEALIHDVCVGHGYCGSVIGDTPRHVTDFIPATGSVTAEQFVLWVFEAEGAGERLRSKHGPALREMFVHHMGGDAVDARELRWE